MTIKEKIESTLGEIYRQASATRLSDVAREREYVRLKYLAKDKLIEFGEDWGDWAYRVSNFAGRGHLSDGLEVTKGGSKRV